MQDPTPCWQADVTLHPTALRTKIDSTESISRNILAIRPRHQESNHEMLHFRYISLWNHQYTITTARKQRLAQPRLVIARLLYIHLPDLGAYAILEV